MEHFFPSCNFRARFPETTKAVISYMKEQGVVTENCCRICKDHPDEGDTILTICTTCRLILAENRQDCNVETVYDHIRRDHEFSYPDLSGRHFILQECGKADDAFRNSVHRLLDEMKVDYEISVHDPFCGRFMMNEIPERNMTAAPKAMKALKEKQHICDKQEQDRIIMETAESMAGKEILVYCNSCYSSLAGAGANVIHLAQLLFGTRD